ncbi:hypothetical protein BC829DRAFT_406086 [Chytridium lagenaria]|nr:hypothetical protein BC829DRAFT_406086 [Chytridium lagenaria]
MAPWTIKDSYSDRWALWVDMCYACEGDEKEPRMAGGGAKTFEGGRVLDHDEAWKASQDILLGVALSSGNSSSGGGVGEIVGGVLADDGILMPRVLPWPAVLRFLHREGYTAAPPAPESGENGRNATLTPEPPVIIPDETLPDEFIRDLADAWLNVQDPMDVTGVWVATIEQLTGLNVTELVGTPKPTTSALPPGGGDEDDMEAASRRKEMRARERVLMGVGIAVGLAVVISVVAAMFIIAARRKRMKEGGGGGMMKGEGGTTASESVDEIEGRQLARLDGPSVWRVRTL